jgi:amidase
MDPIASPPIDLDCDDLSDAAVLQPGRRTRIRTWPASEYPFLTGPLRIEGVDPGDTLAFHLHALELDPVGHYGFAATQNPGSPGAASSASLRARSTPAAPSSVATR